MDESPPLSPAQSKVEFKEADDDSNGIVNDDASRMRVVGMETLFLMVVGNNIPHLLEWLLLFIEDLQISSGVFPHSGDHSAEGFPLPLWHMYLLNPLAPKSYDTYAPYRAAFFWCCAGLFVWFVNGAYVAYTVYRGKYVILPLVTFRLLSAIFPSFLFIPLVEMLLTALDCSWTSDWTLHIVSEEVVECVSGQHILVFGVAILFLCVFIPLSIFLAFNFVSIDPTYKAPSSRVHGRCDGVYAILKVFLVFAIRAWAESVTVLVSAVLFVALVMLYVIDHYRPHYDPKVNCFRSASFSSTVTFACLIGILRLAKVSEYGVALGILLPCCITAWLTGFKVSAVRYRSRLARIPQRLAKLATLTGLEQQNFLVFDSWPTVEISCRFITEPMNDRRRAFDGELAPLVTRILDRGVLEFPQSPFVHLSYNLYSDFMQSVGNGRVYPLSATKSLSPAFDVSFFVYMTERVELRHSQMSALGQHVELSVTEFAEFKKLEKDAKRNHRRAAQEIRVFWKVLSRSVIDTHALSKVVSDMQEAMDEADKNYRQLLHLYPGSAAMNRAYASFLIEVKNEEETAEGYIQEADYLEEKALAAQRKMLGFSDAEVCRVELESNQKREVSESEAEPEPPLEVEAPVIQVGAWEHEKAVVTPWDLGDEGSDDEGGKKMHRSESRSTDTSKRSGTGNSAHRLAVMNTMGLPALRLLAILNMAALVVSVVTMSAQTFSLISFIPIFQSQNSALHYRYHLRFGTWSGTLVFHEVRRLRMAALMNDGLEFEIRRGRLQDAVTNFKSSIREAFLEVNSEYEELYNLFNTPTASQQLRTFPTNITISDLKPLYGFAENYAGKSAILLDRTLAEFASTDMLFNNDYRYILDNFPSMLTALRQAEEYYPVDAFSNEKSVQIQVWSSAGLTAVVVVICVLLLVERLFGRMEKQHLERLALLRRIPKAIRMAIRDNYELGEDDATISHLNESGSNRGGLSSRRDFRMRGAVFVTLAGIGAFYYAFNGTRALKQMAMMYIAIEPLAQARNYAVSLDTLIIEMGLDDLAVAWPNTSTIQDVYKVDVGSFAECIMDIVYPSSSSVSITDCPPAMQSLWFDPSCLPLNTTICQYPEYDDSIGFTSGIVNNGLGVLAFECLDAASKVASILNGAKLDPNYPPARLFVKANRDHLSGGLYTLSETAKEAFAAYVQDSVAALYTMYGTTAFATFLGNVLLFGAMSRWYRKKDRATSMMFFKLPVNAVRSDKALQTYVETGVMADVQSVVSLDENASGNFAASQPAKYNGLAGAILKVFAPKGGEKPHVPVGSLEIRRRSAALSASFDRRGNASRNSRLESLASEHRLSVAPDKAMSKEIMRSGHLAEDHPAGERDNPRARGEGRMSVPSVLVNFAESAPPPSTVDDNK